MTNWVWVLPYQPIKVESMPLIEANRSIIQNWSAKARFDIIHQVCKKKKEHVLKQRICSKMWTDPSQARNV